MGQLFFSKQQLEDRLSKRRVQAIYDDDNDGTADASAIDQLRTDASSKVESYLAPLGVLPFDDNAIPPEVVRLALDVAVAMACQRHPEIMRQDWVPLMDKAEEELGRLRDGKTTLGPAPVPQPKNQGGAAYSGDATTASGEVQRRWEKMGDF